MTDWEITRHQVAIAGKVTDAQTSKGIGNALVRIASPHAEITESTAIDGHFHALDLANGTYELEATVSGVGYVPGTAQATVTRNGEGRILMASVDMQLSKAK